MERVLVFIKEKKMGLGLMGISLSLFYLLLSLMETIKENSAAACSCAAGTCPMDQLFPPEAYLGMGFIALLFFIGVSLTFSARRLTTNTSAWQKNRASLNGDEKMVYEQVMAADGVLFQSELVEKTAYPKARVSRVLDKLEAKGLLERKRRGLSNVVVLKSS